MSKNVYMLILKYFIALKHADHLSFQPVVIPFLMFWGTSILFYIVAAPIYIFTNSAQAFPFLYTLANTDLLSFWWELF